MSTQEFKPGDRVRVVRPIGPLVEGDEHTVTGVATWGKVILKETSEASWMANRFVKVEPEWVVGQQVSGTDYDQLPVGAKASVGGSGQVTRGPATWVYDSGAPCIPGSKRTITHLPDATQPEDETDAYAEPEPLKEGDWVQVWAKVHDPSPKDDELVELRVRIRGGGMATAYTTADAIVRPDAGSLPPWIKPIEEPKDLGVVVYSEGEAKIFTRASIDPEETHVWASNIDRCWYAWSQVPSDAKVIDPRELARGGAS